MGGILTRNERKIMFLKGLKKKRVKMSQILHFRK